jgi:hypothetical protein
MQIDQDVLVCSIYGGSDTPLRRFPPLASFCEGMATYFLSHSLFFNKALEVLALYFLSFFIAHASLLIKDS